MTLKRDVEISKPEKRITEIAEMVPHTQSVFNRYERQGCFNKDINPVLWNEAIPVTSSFPYLPDTELEKRYAEQRVGNRKTVDDWVKENNITIDIIGIENLSEINGVVVSNHYCIFDWYFIGRALKEKTEKDTYTITAEFNYRRNPIGDLILSERCWPICNYRHFGQTDEEKQKIKKNLKDAISTRLEKGDNVLVLTSGTMWNMYTKPQPSKRGAFFWAIENDKPVLPVFATNKPNGEQDEMKPELNKNIKIHFGAPIYHDPDLIPEENVTDMIRSVFKWQQSIYEHEYGFKLEYGCALKWNDYVKSGASATAIQEFIGNHKTV